MSKSVYITAVFFLMAFAAFAGREEDFRFAQKLYTDGYYDLAAEQFAKFVENYPDDSRIAVAYFMRGKALFNLQNWNGARIAFMRVTLEYGNSYNASEALFLAAVCLQKEGKIDDAARNFLSVSDYFTRSEFAAKGLVEAGKIYRSLGDLHRSRIALERIINDFPKTASAAEAYFQLAEMSSTKDDISEALQYYQLTVENTDNEELKAKSHIARALIFYQSGDWNRAEDEVESVKSPLEYFNYGRILKGIWLQKQGDFNTAEKLLRLVINSAKVDTVKQKALICLADNLYLNEKYPEALDLYLSVTPNDTLALRLGITCQKLDKYPQAVEAFTAVLKGNTDYSEKAIALQGLHSLYGKAGLKANISDALTSYIPKLQEIPHWESFAISMGKLAYNDGNLDLAEKFFLKLQDSRSMWNDDGWYFQALILAKKGAIRQSLAILDTLKQVFPGSDYAAQVDSLYRELKDNLPPDNLVDEVARLSAAAVEFHTRGEVNLHWGKGYYLNFKEYAKACEQLNSALKSRNLDKDKTAEASAYLAMALDKRISMEPALLDSALKVKQSYLLSYPRGDYAGKFNLDLLRHQVSGISEPTAAEKTWTEGLEELLNKFDKDDALPEIICELSSIYCLHKDKAQMVLEFNDKIESNFPQSQYRELVLFNCADAFLSLDDSSAALQKYQEYILSYPAGIGIFTAKKMSAMMMRDVDGKITMISKLIEDYYYNSGVIALEEYLGDLYLENEKYKEALSTFQLLETASAGGQVKLSEDLSYKIGLSYQKIGDFDKAQQYFLDYAVNHSSGKYWEQAIFALGELSETADQAPSALKFYENLLSRGGNQSISEAAKQRMASIYYKIGQYVEGRNLYLQLAANAAHQDKVMEYTSWAIIGLYRQGLLDDGRQQALEFAAKFKKSPKLEEYQAKFYLEKAKAQAEEKNFSEALKTLEYLTKKYAKTTAMPEAEYETGRILLLTNQYDAALTVLTAMPQKYPQNSILSSVYVTLGAFYYRQQQYQNALVAFQKVLEDESAREMWGAALLNLEVTYKDLGLWEAAYAILIRYLELFPYSDDVISKKLDAAQLLIRMKEYDRAIDKLKALLPQVSTEMRVEVQFYLGEAYFQKTDYQQAALEYMKAKYLDPGGGLDWAVTSIYNAGRCYEKLGKIDEARNLYQEIIKKWGADSDYGKGAQQRIEFLKNYKK